MSPAAEPQNPASSDSPDRWFFAVDIDGTLVHENGAITDAVRGAVGELIAQGHELVLATGRSMAETLPELERFAITPEYIVCANGSISLRRDASAPMGYLREVVETFDPADVLAKIRPHLKDFHYAVEDETGLFRYTEPFPATTMGLNSQQVSFEELMTHRATRVIVHSPDHEIEEFLELVERIGLHSVTYSIGWSAWLDIAPDGVNKSKALERVRKKLGIPRTRVFAIGDGRNDIDMLTWASEQGRSVAMGQAPPEVQAVADSVTGSIEADGAALALSEFLSA